MGLFDSNAPNVHDSSPLAQDRTDFFIDFAEEVLFEFDDWGDKVQIFHEIVVKTLGDVCDVHCYADTHRFVRSFSVEASDRDPILSEILSEQLPNMFPFFYFFLCSMG